MNVTRDTMIKASDLPLVHGAGKLTPEMLRFIDECAKYFPGCEKDIIIIRKPISPLPRRAK
jgi:hypothetical protein